MLKKYIGNQIYLETALGNEAFALRNEIHYKFYAFTYSHSSAARKRIKGDLPRKHKISGGREIFC